ncbi:MAG: hypothetical protein NTY71_01180 [Methanoregula sp.]|nr:hypothetical protein [Methanoregula sp.]
MSIIDHIKEKIKKETINFFSPNNLLYFLFPIILLIILYASFFPFNQVYISEWHDIFANSMYYTLVDHNYFVTWNNLWSGGFPLIASPHSDKYYIFSFPAYLIFQNLSIVNFIILFHLLIAYFGFFKFGSLITKNYNALLIFSLFFTFSGTLLGRIYAGHHLLLYGLVWIPLLYYFFFKIVVFDECTLMNTIFLSIVSVLMYFTGNIYHFVLTYLIIFIFFLYYAINKKIPRKILYYLALSVFLIILLISIKSIPDLGVSGSIIRNDPIDPLAGGGSIEKDFLSFITGTGIDTLWGSYESAAMIGIIPLLLMIVALIFGRREITTPSFCAILVSFIWAAGGKTVLYFVHLLPLVNTFRVPGRIFGALLPLVLCLALYGAIILYEKFKKGEPFAPSPDQQKHIIIGLALVLLVKLFELPYQEMISPEAAVSVILICAFVALIYFQKGSTRNILYFFIIALVINLLLLIRIYSVLNIDILIKLGLMGVLLSGLFIFIQKTRSHKKNCSIFCGILIAGIFLMVLGNLGIGYVTAFNPMLDKSPAPEIINEIKKNASDTAQLWVYETGWPIKHMEFTYWDVINGIHPMTLYTAYFLKTSPSLTYTVGNVTYFSADYIIDTQYLENGNQNLPEYTFKVQNISVYKPEHVLPNIFIIRDSQVYPLTIEKFSPDEVIASGELIQGDVVILKGAYDPGWKANGADAEPVGNMIGTKLPSGTKQIRFNFDPLDYKIGALLSGCGIILVIMLIIKRKEIDGYISKISEQESAVGRKKRKKRIK